jgi:hypothetical protein
LPKPFPKGWYNREIERAKIMALPGIGTLEDYLDAHVGLPSRLVRDGKGKVDTEAKGYTPASGLSLGSGEASAAAAAFSLSATVDDDADTLKALTDAEPAKPATAATATAAAMLDATESKGTAASMALDPTSFSSRDQDFEGTFVDRFQLNYIGELLKHHKYSPAINSSFLLYADASRTALSHGILNLLRKEGDLSGSGDSLHQKVKGAAQMSMIRKACKFGALYFAASRQLFYMLDGIDMQWVANPRAYEGGGVKRPITTSELRCLFRNWYRLPRDGIHFLHKFERVSAPWEQPMWAELWSPYASHIATKTLTFITSSPAQKDDAKQKLCELIIGLAAKKDHAGALAQFFQLIPHKKD